MILPISCSELTLHHFPTGFHLFEGFNRNPKFKDIQIKKLDGTRYKVYRCSRIFLGFFLMKNWRLIFFRGMVFSVGVLLSQFKYWLTAYSPIVFNCSKTVIPDLKFRLHTLQVFGNA